MKMFYCVVQQHNLLQASCFGNILRYTDGRIFAANVDSDGELFRMCQDIVRNGEFVGEENGA